MREDGQVLRGKIYFADQSRHLVLFRLPLDGSESVAIRLRWSGHHHLFGILLHYNINVS